MKATIQGKQDIGQSLVTIVNKMKAHSVPNLIGKLGDWLDKQFAKENARKNPNPDKLIRYQDTYDSIICFTTQAETVADVIKKIDLIFTDNKDTPGIRLSSIHKSKGLEANRVFLIQPKGAECPHPAAKNAWQREQEMNLLYISITRAISEFTYVS